MVSTRLSGNFGGGCESPSPEPEPEPSKSTRTTLVQTSSSEPSTSEAAQKSAEPKPPPHLLDFPAEVMEKIFSYLSYKTIANLRSVCHKINSICIHMLNTTFQRLQGQMLMRFQSIKAKMPRRESARRNHPLACESDIVETLHMRLTLLQMTFGKHIERRHICFFAGEILDEVYRILYYINRTPVIARPYKVTDELFDLSTMAMEYFKENIEPKLPELNYINPTYVDFSTAYNSQSYLCLDGSSPSSTSRVTRDDSRMYRNERVSAAAAAAAMCFEDDDLDDPPPQSNMVLRKRIRKIKQGMKRYNNQLSLMRRDLRNCKNKIADQQKQILDYAARLDENDKKNEETSRKFSTLLQELNKCKTELQYWRAKSPAIPPVCVTCGVAVAPAPPEDLQALANQGALPQGLDLAAIDFVPIAGSVNNPPVTTVQDTVTQQKQLQEHLMQQPQSAFQHPEQNGPSDAGTAMQNLQLLGGDKSHGLPTSAVPGNAATTSETVTIQLATPIPCRVCPTGSKRKTLDDASTELEDSLTDEITLSSARPSSPSTDETDGSASPMRVRRFSKCRVKRLKVQ